PGGGRRRREGTGGGQVVARHTEGPESRWPGGEGGGAPPPPIRLFRVPDPLPRLFLVGAARSADDRDALALLLDPDFDPRREVVLPPGAATTSPGGTPRGSLTVVESRADRLHLTADAEQPGWRSEERRVGTEGKV